MTIALPIDLGEHIVHVPTPFQTIVADPPWQPNDALPGPKRGASKHYTTMPTRDICALAYRFPPIADDALLFCWRLSSMPFDGLDVCRAWGFEPVSEIVWVKTPTIDVPKLVGRGTKAVRALFDQAHLLDPTSHERTFAASIVSEHHTTMVFEQARRVRILLGHYVRLSHETCIIAARPGAASRIKRHNIPSVMFAPLGAHSAKPDAFFDLVGKLAPGPYLELFARKARGPSWTAIGDALGSTLDLPLAPGGGR